MHLWRRSDEITAAQASPPGTVRSAGLTGPSCHSHAQALYRTSPFCRSYFFMAVIRHHNKSNLWKEGFVWAHNSTSPSRQGGVTTSRRCGCRNRGSSELTSSSTNTKQRKQTGSRGHFKSQRPPPSDVPSSSKAVLT